MKLNVTLGTAILLAIIAAIFPIVSHNRLRTLEADCSSLQSQNADLERQLQNAAKEVLESHSASERRSASLAAENRNLRLSNEELDAKLNMVTADLAKFRAVDSGIAEIRKQQSELRVKLEALRKEADATKLRTWR